MDLQNSDKIINSVNLKAKRETLRESRESIAKSILELEEECLIHKGKLYILISHTILITNTKFTEYKYGNIFYILQYSTFLLHCRSF